MELRFRVNGRIIDFGHLEEDEHDRLLADWHKSQAIECLCHGDAHSPNPLLYVKKINDGLFLANYPRNSKLNILHHFQCKYNRQGYRSLLESKGLKITESEIICTLDLDLDAPRRDTTSTRPAAAVIPREQHIRRESVPRVKLETLFLTMLQEYKVSEYRPGGRRNISKRLYKVAQTVKINRRPLANMLYIASTPGWWPKKDKHQMIIGWGHRRAKVTRHPTNPRFLRIPLYSIDDPDTHICDLTLLKSVFDRCEREGVAGEEGYYILFRGPLHSRDTVKWDRVLCFIPAERMTRIPVMNDEERELVHFLYEHQRHFEKPLIGNVTEMFLEGRPDFILHDTEPKTIVEIRSSIDRKKQNAYREKGYLFAIWNGKALISPQS